MKISNNPAKYELLIKQYLRSVLDISGYLCQGLKLSYQAGKKIESTEGKGSVKIWELDSDNSDVYNDSSVEIDTADESSDSSRSIGIFIIYAHLFRLAFFVRFPASPRHSNIRIHFLLPHFDRPEKPRALVKK